MRELRFEENGEQRSIPLNDDNARAQGALAQAVERQLGGHDNPIAVSSDVSMQDAASIQSDNREPPPAAPSLREGSRVEYTPGVVVGAAILCRSRGDVGGSRTKGHDINKAILRAAYIAAGGLLHWPDANAREVLPLRMYLAA
ncbi:MAG: hypothetical protein M1840_007198 [Geoglossum simile]|nr:MAG: hypothetical protein M1840_007198 [Geoglossum simile]